MKLLAIDTSTHVMSVAFLDMHTRKVVGEITTKLPQNHSTSLMPSISHLMELLKCTVDDVAAVTVASGPGAYTGIRIGVATAKTLSWSRDVPLYSVSSLATLAMNGLRWNGFVVPMFDARRGRVYSGLYQAEEGHLLELLPDRVVAITEWIAEVNQLQSPVLFLGEVDSFREEIIEVMDGKAHFGTVYENVPHAAQVGILGLRKWANQVPAEKDTFCPNYCQPTEAESKRMHREKGL